MSRHHFTGLKDGHALTVVMGYDRPLDYVFMTVQAANGVMLYSNLSDPEAQDCQDVGYYAGVLKEMDITVPESMFVEVAKDQLRQTGNRVLVHPLQEP